MYIRTYNERDSLTSGHKITLDELTTTQVNQLTEQSPENLSKY